MSVTLPGGTQSPTIAGLKSQYRSLLEPLKSQLLNKELTCTSAIPGKFYEKNIFRLMYVGRAVNGWETNWSESSLDDLIDQVFNQSFELSSIFEKPEQNGYNFNRSPFWQLCKQLLINYGITENWSDQLLWSNLYKVAPFKTGNPNNTVIKNTIASCIRILTYEINLYQPTHIVFVTDSWWFDPHKSIGFSFAEQFGIKVIHNTDSVIVGKGTLNGLNNNAIKVIVTKRPESAHISRQEHAKLIFDTFAAI